MLMRLTCANSDERRRIESHPVLVRLAGKRYRLAFASWDASGWAMALYFATLLRDEYVVEVSASGLACAWAVTLVAQILVGRLVTHSYGGRHGTGTVDDAIIVSTTAFLTGTVAFAANLAVQPGLPRSVPLIACPVAVVLHLGARIAVRLHRERRSRPNRDRIQRVLVVGTGADSQQPMKTMLSNPKGSYLPGGILDDNPQVKRLRVSEVPVRGTCTNTAEVARTTGADLLVIADRSASSESMRRVAGLAKDARIGVKVLPPFPEMLRPSMGVTELRDLDIDDFLGRRPVQIDVSRCASYLTNRRVLITGAGGSIGSELCRQVHCFGPSDLLMLDRDESALHDVQLSLYGHALLDSSDVILADIRDASTITEIFLARRPEVVFHAAALKHLPMLEQYPDEAWKTNVLGTQNVLAAARLAKVERFVNISSDKAANPVSVLGLSKRVGERLTAYAAHEHAGTYLSVRFGNVLGSRGSVLTTFAEQLSKGVPITVTHPDVTRFFMTIPEAVQLVVYAAAIGNPGEVLVLDMGNQVRIADVAAQMMTLTGKTVGIVYTGLRDGEKLHEELFGVDEVDRRPTHPMISQVNVPEIHPELLAVTRSVAGTCQALWEIGGGASVSTSAAATSAAGVSAVNGAIGWQPT